MGYFLTTRKSHEIKVRRYSFITDKFAAGEKPAFRVALVSDLHDCAYGEEQAELLRLIGEQKPDLIFMAGDMADEIKAFAKIRRIKKDAGAADNLISAANLHKNSISLMRGLSGVCPCYYVTGNHEHKIPYLDELLGEYKKSGVILLDNAASVINVNGKSILICGVRDVISGDDMMKSINAALGGNETRGVFSILLSHRPEHFKIYAEIGFSLSLSGHAHGGQWRLPGILNGLYAPGQGLFPRYAGGFYKRKNSYMAVSRGLAYDTLRTPRIFNPPEICVIDVFGG